MDRTAFGIAPGRSIDCGRRFETSDITFTTAPSSSWWTTLRTSCSPTFRRRRWSRRRQEISAKDRPRSCSAGATMNSRRDCSRRLLAEELESTWLVKNTPPSHADDAVSSMMTSRGVRHSGVMDVDWRVWTEMSMLPEIFWWSTWLEQLGVGDCGAPFKEFDRFDQICLNFHYRFTHLENNYHNDFHQRDLFMVRAFLLWCFWVLHHLVFHLSNCPLFILKTNPSVLSTSLNSSIVFQLVGQGQSFTTVTVSQWQCLS